MTKPFAAFYDALSDKAAARERALKVARFVRRHHPDARSVLELGTGNGNVLANFPEKYELYGLDIEEAFIELTRQKVPEAHLFVASMHDFEMDSTVDVIFSVYDSINFLKAFQQWEETFAAVHKHLNQDGLFIFDAYTPWALERNRGAPAVFSEGPFGFSSDKGIVEGNRLTWDYKLFERIERNVYELHQYYFKERVYPIKEVEGALTKHFLILERVDAESLEDPSEQTLRILYVARRA